MWDSKIKPSRSLKRSRFTPSQFANNRRRVPGLDKLKQQVRSARSAVLLKQGNQQYSGLVGPRSSPYDSFRLREGVQYTPKFTERFRPREHRRHRRNYGEKRPIGRIYPISRMSGVSILPASSYGPPHQMYNTIMGSGIVDINSDGRDLFAYRNEPNPMGDMLNQFVTRPMMQSLPYHNYFFAHFGRIRNREEWKQDKFDYRQALQVLNHAPARAVTSYPTFSMGRNVSSQMSEVFKEGGNIDREEDTGDFQSEQRKELANLIPNAPPNYIGGGVGGGKSRFLQALLDARDRLEDPDPEFFDVDYLEPRDMGTQTDSQPIMDMETQTAPETINMGLQTDPEPIDMGTQTESGLLQDLLATLSPDLPGPSTPSRNTGPGQRSLLSYLTPPPSLRRKPVQPSPLRPPGAFGSMFTPPSI